jgi:hypothetical protein
VDARKEIHMKKCSIGAVVLITALTAFGGSMTAGTHEFRVDVATDFENNDGNRSLPVFGGVGYCFADDFEGGLYVSMRKTDWDSYWGEDTAWGIGLFGEYDFASDAVLSPFVTVRAGVLDGNESDDTVANIAGGGGVRLYITDALSVAVQAELEWADDEVFDFTPANVEEDGTVVREASGDRTDIIGRIGVRYFF